MLYNTVKAISGSTGLLDATIAPDKAHYRARQSLTWFLATKPCTAALAFSLPGQLLHEPDSKCCTALAPERKRASPHAGQGTFLGLCTCGQMGYGHRGG